MKRYIAALYASGKLVTGANHGEAFGKLTVEEQNGDLASGFLDPETGRFFTEEYDFFLKQVYLVRHGESHGSHADAYLTDIGILQARRAAEFLEQFDLAEFEAFTSPFRRCLQTAEIISQVTGLKFYVEPNIREKMHEEEFVPSHSLEYPAFKWPADQGWKCSSEDPAAFLGRIDRVLCGLPAKTVIVSHCDFIVNFAQEAIGEEDITEHCEWRNSMPGGSVTMIDARRLVCIGRECLLHKQS